MIVTRRGAYDIMYSYNDYIMRTYGGSIMLKIKLCASLSEYEDGVALISKKLGSEYCVSENIDTGVINICSLEEAKGIDGVLSLLPDKENDERWHLIYKTDDGGYIICGDRKLDCLHALLKVIDMPDACLREYNVSRFNRLYENFDDFYGGFARAADDFDLELHMIDAVRTGVESFEINTLYDDIPIQVRERAHQNDVYYWWCTYCPGLDMFYESRLFRGVHKESMLEKNRQNLKNNARLAKILGLAPVFTSFEPRCIPERFFAKYPELRGARVDYDAYSAAPEYGLDPTHPLVLEHFSEMMDMLMQDVPELALFEIWSQDSNASFPWADRSYMKSNGPLRLFEKQFHEIVNPLLTTLADTAHKYNSQTKVNLNLDWVFSDREKSDVINHLPEQVGVTFNFTSFASGADDYGLGNAKEYKEKLVQRMDDAQFITNGIAHDWKTYAPLVGFPFPRATYNHLVKVINSGVKNFTLRGGLCSRAFVPEYINNEVVRAVKYGKIDNIEDFLADEAKRFTKTDAEADVLFRVWEICDRFHRDLPKAKRIPGTSDDMYWACSLFVSSRTLFRKLFWPAVPNQKALTFNETRYYKPYMFYTYETDPSWLDMSCFNFQQKTSDAVLRHATKTCEEMLIPELSEALSLIDGLGNGVCDYLSDLRDRIAAMRHMIFTDKALMKVQYLTHESDRSSDKESYKALVREEMLAEIENTRAFASLLDSSESTLIPTTSGEETVYMYKTPMSNSLKRKVIVMEKHLDDDVEGIKLDY